MSSARDPRRPISNGTPSTDDRHLNALDSRRARIGPNNIENKGSQPA
ncbi:uncharacterized protein METZ01_LOCUS169551 [marine metagenome]|uniref:Uncharacterized protein n=1 Tax=marine metagenome TaxID=408172 RepID=A0A382BU06_9ZZZZ